MFVGGWAGVSEWRICSTCSAQPTIRFIATITIRYDAMDLFKIRIFVAYWVYACQHLPAGGASYTPATRRPRDSHTDTSSDANTPHRIT